jgi:hypothetical protein
MKTPTVQLRPANSITLTGMLNTGRTQKLQTRIARLRLRMCNEIDGVRQRRTHSWEM